METTTTTTEPVETPVAAPSAPAADKTAVLESTFNDMLSKAEEAKPVPAPEPTEEVEEQHVEGDWIDDELLADATARGLTEDELATFASPEQYRATMRVADKNLRTSARDHYQPKQQPTEQKPVGSQPAATDPTDPLAALDKALASFTTDNWDEDTVKDIAGFKEAVKSIVSLQKQQLDQATQWIAQQEQQRVQQANLHEAQQFASIVEKMGMKELFGESFEKATPEQQQQWAKAFNSYLEIKHGEGLRTGNLPPLSERLVKRALHSEFADHFIKQTERAMAQKVRTSAAKRMGGGSRHVTPGPYRGPTNENPVLAEAWNKLNSDPEARLTK